MNDDLDFTEDVDSAVTGAPTLTDKGNAEVFAAQNAGAACWCASMPGDGWMTWDAYRWRPDMNRRTVQAAMQIGEWWRKQAPPAVPDGSSDPRDEEQAARRKAILSHAMRSESARAVRGMLDLAQPLMAVEAGRFDAGDMLLCTPARTYDLATWKHRAPAPGDYVTRATSVNVGGDCPTWIAFLDRIMGGDAEMVAYLQRVVGYCLTGSTAEQCIFIAHGSGANGKSTFMEAIAYVMGDYATTTSVDTFTARRQGAIPNDLAALAGARLVSCSETAEGGGLDEGLVKQISGGEQVSARFLQREFFTFTPKFKLWMLTNHKPIIKGTDNGIWRRIRLIPFDVTIPPEERDKDLPAKLRAEAGGILKWALSGLRQWREGGLKDPEKVKAATDSYRGEMDILGDFLNEMCLVGAGHKITNGLLYSTYSQWARDNGLQPKSHKWLTRALLDKGVQQSSCRSDGRMWIGVTLR